jgi:hypothetical protein
MAIHARRPGGSERRAAACTWGGVSSGTQYEAPVATAAAAITAPAEVPPPAAATPVAADQPPSAKV